MPHPKIRSLRGKNVFVTGAASGIGRAVAEAAAGTEEVSRQTLGVLEGADRAGAATADLRQASGGLTRQAAELRRTVDRFLVEVRAA